MFAPASNRNRALFTLTFQGEGQVDLYCESEAFKTFFNLDPVLVEQQIGPVGPTLVGAAELRVLADGIDELMADAEQPAGAGAKRSWNGRDFYVALRYRDWEQCKRFGVVAAGGRRLYSKPLEQLFPGARVFAYMPGAGYVGIGRVRETVKPAKEFMVSVDGRETPLLAVPGIDAAFSKTPDDADNCEYVVGVEWKATRSVVDAIWETGMFANQMTVCRLRDEETIEAVAERMGASDST